MKKLFLLLTAGVILQTFSVEAQTTLGVHAGANLTTKKTNANFKGMIFGYNLGWTAEFQITERLLIQSELNISQLGYHSGSTSKRLNYLEIPIFPKYKFNRLGLFAGPQISILLSENDDVYDYKKIDLGVNAGLEYDLSDNLNLSARYRFSLSSATKYNPTNAFWSNNGKNIGFGLLLGYKLR